MRYRTATPADAPAIARLHLLNWQTSYRGALSDHYLDVVAPTERQRVWAARFTDPQPGMIVIVAEDEQGLQGFCCTFLHHGPDGHLLDNLHVAAAHRGKGIGKQLMRRTARRVAEFDDGPEIFLWVLTTNHDALAFYERLGGRKGRTELKHLQADRGVAATAIHWSVADLADR